MKSKTTGVLKKNCVTLVMELAVVKLLEEVEVEFELRVECQVQAVQAENMSSNDSWSISADLCLIRMDLGDLNTG